jgi:hypothetical protein
VPWRKNPQIQKFREASRAIAADESEERFDAALKELAKAPRKSATTNVQGGNGHVSGKGQVSGKGDKGGGKS